NSCSDSELTTPGDEFQIPLESGTFIADLNGVTYDFSETAAVNSNELTTNISGVNEEGQSINLFFPAALEEGNYTQANGAVVSLVMGGEEGIFSNLGANGQLLPSVIRITDLNMVDMVVSGVFSGEVYNAVAEETLEITNGKFQEIPFTIIESGDGILKGMFDSGTGAVLLDFSTDAVASGNVTNATISGQNDEMQTLVITVPGGLEVGTLTEVDEVMINVSMATSENPNDVYTNYDAENETFLPFTLVITEITEGEDARVKGTFTGTIKKFIGGTG